MTDIRWTPSLVEEHLVEAADVLKRLPERKAQGYFNTWPAMSYEFSDLVGLSLQQGAELIDFRGDGAVLPYALARPKMCRNSAIYLATAPCSGCGSITPSRKSPRASPRHSSSERNSSAATA